MVGFPTGGLGVSQKEAGNERSSACYGKGELHTLSSCCRPARVAGEGVIVVAVLTSENGNLTEYVAATNGMERGVKSEGMVELFSSGVIHKASMQSCEVIVGVLLMVLRGRVKGAP